MKPKSSTIERDSYSHQDYSKFDRDDAKRGKSPWGRVKTIIERRRDSLKRRSLRRDHGCLDCDSVHLKKTPEVAEIKSYADYVESSLRQPVITDSHKHKHHHVPDPIIIDEEVDYRGPRTPSSSPTFHRKSRWTRVKKALTGKKEGDHDPSSSTPASPNAAQDGHFTFDAIEGKIALYVMTLTKIYKFFKAVFLNLTLIFSVFHFTNNTTQQGWQRGRSRKTEYKNN